MSTPLASSRPIAALNRLRHALIGLAWVSCASLLLSGCMSAAHIAQNLDNQARISETTQGITLLRAHISKLQAAGDPLGDYYYALGNSDGWIADVSDPQAITALFEKAAAKGSMDAKILLALQLASDDALPGRLDYSHGPSKDLGKWEQGLGQLLPLVQQQCSVRRLVVDDGRARTSYYSIAYDVWPHFRNGYFQYNGDGSRVLLKDPARQKLWEDIHRKCTIPQFEWIKP
ncbi:hypothetical protein [Hydrogenophaga sp. PAMC20947]|uniref:hypothetical protein n=1 Tax=Hydrogenophaga sp. PAMC20947 TaxID=2565558 RepID=UPI00109E31CA|nr:hypothetical protein [Hydrogenophaga sp. PAMC20947]QCB47743.1 hypothetical protein E5678_17910 [Hydrogenophaga sp. PAMC20947]